MKRKIPLLILALLFLAMTGYAVSQLLLQRQEYQAGEDSYDALAQYVHLPETAPTQPSSTQPDSSEAAQQTEQTEPEDGTVWPSVDFEALQAVNPDVCAWIYLEGTNINYPVVQGADNSEYLHKMVDGSYNSAGSIFMDYRNAPDFTDPHTILYGHHMKNETMFCQITYYHHQDFYEAHPTALLLTPQGNYKLELFSGYVAHLNGQSWKLQFGTDEEYAAWLEDALARSTFQSAVTPTPQDRVVTLSTCSYEYDDARYVLLGILVPQE